MERKKILWADDEIELLRPHILFLEERGYDVTAVTNGEDAIAQARRNTFDVILLDEHMSGKDGIATFSEIKALRPGISTVMITKSEEEGLMEEAIGQQIDDFLTKPVNPSQILLVLKKLTEEDKQRSYRQGLFSSIQPDFRSDFRRRILGGLDRYPR